MLVYKGDDEESVGCWLYGFEAPRLPLPCPIHSDPEPYPGLHVKGSTTTCNLLNRHQHVLKCSLLVTTLYDHETLTCPMS